MEKTTQRISDLIFRYIDKTINDRELQELNAWVNSNEKNKELFLRITSTKNFYKYHKLNSEIDKNRAWNNIDSRLKTKRKWSFTQLVKYAAIIVLPIVISLAIFDRINTEETVKIANNNIIPAGTQKAHLILANGNKIELSKSDSSEIYSDNEIHISNSSALLEYKCNKKMDIKELKYNELDIPKGAEYQIRLSDGTHVLLNSKSKLRFPEVFSKNKRVVYLKGEAFFNVVHSDKSPFYVVTDDVSVKVYGTRFNINTHKKDVVQTTLVDGKVSLKSKNEDKEYFLKPEQLGEYSVKKKNIIIRDVDVDLYTGWTESKFVFEDEKLESILETLSLWYDVEVFFQNEEVKNLKFTGYMKRYSDINKILSSLEETISVRFKINKKCITVLNRTKL